MESLHGKLEKIKSEFVDRSPSENGNMKQKSVIGSVTHQPLDWKKSIRRI